MSETPTISDLISAAVSDDVPRVKALVEAGVPVDGISTGNAGHTPMTLAVLRGASKAVKALLDCGADPDAADHFGRTGLVMAACCGRLNLVQMLVERGADTARVGGEGRTALATAVMEHKQDIVDYLKAVETEKAAIAAADSERQRRAGTVRRQQNLRRLLQDRRTPRFRP